MGGVKVEVRLLRTSPLAIPADIPMPGVDRPEDGLASTGWRRQVAVLQPPNYAKSVYTDSCRLYYWLDPDNPAAVVDAVDQGLHRWLKIVENWADLFRASAGPQIDWIGRPMAVGRFRTRDGMRTQLPASGTITPEVKQQPLPMGNLLLAFTLRQAAALADVPLPWQLIRQADRAASRREARVVASEAGAAAEAVFSQLLDGLATSGDGQSTGDRLTLGQKIAKFETEGGLLPGGLTFRQLREELLKARNSAIHGRQVGGEDASRALEHARTLAAAAFPLPAYENADPVDRAGIDVLDSSESALELFATGFALASKGEAAAHVVMAAAAQQGSGDAAMWVANDWLDGTLVLSEGEDEDGQDERREDDDDSDFGDEGGSDFLLELLEAMTKTRGMDIEGVGQAHLLRGHIFRSLGQGRRAVREFRRAQRCGVEGVAVALWSRRRSVRIFRSIASLTSGAWVAGERALAQDERWTLEDLQGEESPPGPTSSWIYDPTGWFGPNTEAERRPPEAQGPAST
ncbi:hypothetical protein [Nocardioides sp. 503]|uniref:hypothetical protein n=1 Tax=Nocardioides sp. 503 TaxID=2508326 RepID=UPI00107019C7|nr:hypothetical protein [Nocardioides sp. 503]